MFEVFHYVIELFNRVSIRKCELEKYVIPLDEHQICSKGVNLVFGNINTPYYFGLRILSAIMAEGSRILTQTQIKMKNSRCGLPFLSYPLPLFR